MTGLVTSQGWVLKWQRGKIILAEVSLSLERKLSNICQPCKWVSMSLPDRDIKLKQINSTKGQIGGSWVQDVLSSPGRELDKSNIRFAGQCSPRCCRRWPAWRSTSQRTREIGLAGKHCWWRWCRCCPCSHHSHSYLPDAPHSQKPRRRWSLSLVSPKGKPECTTAIIIY